MITHFELQIKLCFSDLGWLWQKRNVSAILLWKYPHTVVAAVQRIGGKRADQ